jgi:hypothetical protein
MTNLLLLLSAAICWMAMTTPLVENQHIALMKVYDGLGSTSNSPTTLCLTGFPCQVAMQVFVLDLILHQIVLEAI